MQEHQCRETTDAQSRDRLRNRAGTRIENGSDYGGDAEDERYGRASPDVRPGRASPPLLRSARSGYQTYLCRA